MSTPPPSTSAVLSPRQGVSSASHPLQDTASQTSTPASGQRAPPLRSLDLSHLLAEDAAQRDADREAGAAPAVAAAGEQAAADEADAAEEGNQALRVRGNMLRSTYEGFKELGRARRWILVLRAMIAVVQIVLGIVIMALPSSLGDSLAQREVCDPEGMFVFLVLHTFRVICSLPLDIYLGLSPHRTPAARRNRTPAARDAREATRRVGNLALDAKISRFSDILGLVHVALFVVGNWTVWNSLECAKPPADSVPLWWSCLALLVITYFVIAEVIVLVCLVVFFLPLLLVILRALGLADRLPQPSIHPSTDKIGKNAIEAHTKLVYFKPAERVADPARSSAEQLRTADAAAQPAEAEEIQQEATAVPLPLSRVATAVTPHDAAAPAPPARRRRGGGLARLFGRRKAAEASSSGENKEQVDEAKAQAGELLYPLHPIPAHRATCPICLVDFEEPCASTLSPSGAAAADASEPSTGAAGAEEEANEVLRLLRCGHVLHRSCVDEWLESVSGRCPICQKAVIPEAETADSERTGDAAA